MRRAFAGMMLFVMVAWFGAGHAAPQNGAVRNRVACDSLVGWAVTAKAIGLPTSGATIAAADLIPATPQTVTGERAVLVLSHGQLPQEFAGVRVPEGDLAAPLG